MNYERPILIVGELYRVREPFESYLLAFASGVILKFERIAYSHYDSSFVYVFKSQSDGKVKEWWLQEDQPSEQWKQFFKPLGAGKK